MLPSFGFPGYAYGSQIEIIPAVGRVVDCKGLEEDISCSGMHTQITILSAIPFAGSISYGDLSQSH